MLLTIDVGNTNITAGVFDGEELAASFRLTTGISRTSDEYGYVFGDLLELNRIPREAVTDAIIASVVPDIMHSLLSGIIKYFEIQPIVVGAGIRTGIRIVTENPRQIGADRIVDAAGAYELYGGPLIVIDFGTATTYDLVDKDGAFLAGVTAPGLLISSKALSEGAANLPEVEIRRPSTILAKETISSMQAGLFFGQIGQTEYIVKRMKKETGCKEMRVIATGGLGDMISRSTRSIDIYNPTLTLEGMRFIYEKQQDRPKKKNG